MLQNEFSVNVNRNEQARRRAGRFGQHNLILISKMRDLRRLRCDRLLCAARGPRGMDRALPTQRSAGDVRALPV